ncbi:transcriptional regulator, AraC family [Amphibacillus marinus]|uniref:Transcriptional regulator, AraC family n=1 Tax=Amphibacillus marinus TaxID=872970 RepID=A0A1H8L6S3_9BACI|nr:AraC family transcriptional regulator [Amphibacillus marinus]SEO00882.1 transcriptional regulator, AraC family [Amphibacillus marinus]
MKVGHCGYSLHTNGYDETRKVSAGAFFIRLQTEGKATTTVNQQTFPLEKGSITIIPSDNWYRLEIADSETSGDFHLFGKDAWINRWWASMDKPFHVKIHDIDQISALWRFLASETRRPPTEQNNDLKMHLFKSICLAIKQDRQERSALNYPFVVTKMKRFIEENALAGLTIQDVAAEVDLSVSRAVHLFKEHTNRTMIEYAHHIRLTTAVNHMAYTNMTLEHIAEKCGFGNYPYFHRVFKRTYGTSPGKYRKQQH